MGLLSDVTVIIASKGSGSAPRFDSFGNEGQFQDAREGNDGIDDGLSSKSYIKKVRAKGNQLPVTALFPTAQVIFGECCGRIASSTPLSNMSDRRANERAKT